MKIVKINCTVTKKIGDPKSFSNTNAVSHQATAEIEPGDNWILCSRSLRRDLIRMVNEALSGGDKQHIQSRVEIIHDLHPREKIVIEEVIEEPPKTIEKPRRTRKKKEKANA
jgi:hypothetical protein